jgi:hypothetical protein
MMGCASVLAAGCREEGGGAGVSAVDSGARAPRPRTTAVAASDAQGRSAEAREFARLFETLSEPSGEHLSTNYVSNETSYLQVAAALEKRARPGGAYIGVGPEQNLTFIAQVRPSLAFIVDIRRENALLHLLFKAAFHQARTRAHWMSLMLGRSYVAEGDPGARGSVEAVLAHAERGAKTRAGYERIHRELLGVVEGGFGIRLTPEDKKTLRATHDAFFSKQLELKYELAQSGRQYPALRKILTMKSPEGRAGGFLARESSFRFVQRLQRDHRIVPVVGDFAGDRALQGVAREIRRRKLTLSAFYVSNVEQYILEPPQWKRYVRNVEAMPSDERSLFVRSYLDQGRRHPRQRVGHRTTTLLQRITDFRSRQATKGYASFWQIVNDRPL